MTNDMHIDIAMLGKLGLTGWINFCFNICSYSLDVCESQPDHIDPLAICTYISDADEVSVPEEDAERCKGV